MALPTSLIFLFPGENGSIPANWSRETALDGKFFSVVTTDAGTTGGGASHTHTADHTHTIATNAASGLQRVSCDENTNGTKHPATTTHSHAATSDYCYLADITTNAATNLPPYLDVIFIKPNGTPTGVPDDAWALWDGANLPSGWIAATNPDPRDRFLRGAVASGNSGGSGGSATHTHTEPAHDHITEGDGLSGHTNSASSAAHITDGGAGYFASDIHGHAITFNAATETMSTDNGEPAYEKLQVVQNDTGGQDLPYGIIALYLGDVVDIPTGWARRNPASDTDFVRCASAAGVIGNTGGSRQHGHTGDPHTHTKASNGSATVLTPGTGGVSGVYHSSPTHTHSTYTIGSAGSVVDLCESKAAYPAYVEVMLLKYMAPTTISMSAASLTSSAPSSTTVPGAVTKSMSAASVTSSAGSLSVVPGAVTVAVNPALLASSAESLQVIPGAFTTNMNAATIAASAPGLTLVPGAVTIAMQALTLACSAEALTLYNPNHIVIAMQAAQIVASAEALDVVPGPVSILMAAATIAATAGAGVVSTGGTIVSMNAAVVRATAETLTRRGGSVSLNDGRAVVVLSDTRIGIVSAEGRVIVVIADERDPEVN